MRLAGRAAGSNPRTSAVASWLLLGAGVAATAWAAIFVRLADESPALTIAAYRLGAGAVVLVAAAAILRGPRWWSEANGRWFLLVAAGALLAGHFWSWFASLELTSVGSSVLIVGTQPLLAAAFAAAFLGERPAPAEYVGVAVAFAGLAIIGAGDFSAGASDIAGDGLALVGAACIALHRTVGRHLRPRLSTATYSGLVYSVAAAALWLLVLALRPEVTSLGAQAWTFIALLALVPQVIGHTAFNFALGRLRVVTVSIAAMLEPVAATLLAIPVLGERPGWPTLTGGPLILAGVLLSFWPRDLRPARRAPRRAAP